jgi:hypothetical protein
MIKKIQELRVENQISAEPQPTNKEVTTLDRKKIQELRVAIEAALDHVGLDHGVRFSTGTASFDTHGGTASFKLEVVALGEAGTERDLDAEAFTKHALIIGLKPEDLGKAIKVGDRPFTIAGYRPKAKKNSMVIRAPDGKTYVATVDTVRRGLPVVPA